MTEFAVTAIRYQMDEHLSFEEKGARAVAFVASLKIGQQVVLVFEPDNPGSPNKAIAVYIDYKRIGYIADEECHLVLPLLNEGRAKATIVRKDDHVTFFVSIPGMPDIHKISPSNKRVLPESPLGSSFRMPFTKDENALQLIASELVEIETNKENLPEIMLLTKRYVPLSKISICREDRLWRSMILKKLEHLLGKSQVLGMSDVDKSEMETLCLTLRGVVGDMHRSSEHWPERVFVNHLELLRNDESVNSHLYKKYCETFLNDKPFDEVDKDIIKAEYERLSSWLRSLEWSELRNPKNLMSMGFRVNYLDLSRWELYDLYSILLLLEKLGTEHSEEAEEAEYEEVKESSRRGRPKKAGRKILKSFIYQADDDENTNLRLQSLYHGLLQLQWIAADTEQKSFMSIFSGKDTTCRVKWIGDINTLAELFKELVKRKCFVKLPEGESIWVMVNARFWEKEGNHEFGNDRLRSTSTPTNSKETIDLLVKLMDPDMPLESLKEAM